LTSVNRRTWGYGGGVHFPLDSDSAQH
jgi:hypothetical protein